MKQIRLLSTMQSPIHVLGGAVVRSAAIASQSLVFARDALIVAEGLFTWISAVSAFPEWSASDVARDPLASPWDDIVRMPTSSAYAPGAGLVGPGHNQPAA